MKERVSVNGAGASSWGSLWGPRFQARSLPGPALPPHKGRPPPLVTGSGGLLCCPGERVSKEPSGPTPLRCLLSMGGRRGGRGGGWQAFSAAE